MLTWDPHPLLTPPPTEKIARMHPNELLQLHRTYHEAIKNEREDPYRYGYELEHWKDADAQLGASDDTWFFGGNRSGKTTYAGKRVVNALMQNPGSVIFCWSQSFETSIRQQQPVIYHYLPKEYKRKLKTTEANISYTLKRGFTDGWFILPNGSQCWFKHYTQFINDPSCIEGAELGCPLKERSPYYNIGNWFDEYLIGEDLYNTMMFRLATRNAKNITTFTAIDGYTDVVRNILTGAKTLDTRPAPILGKNRTVPYIQQPKKQNARVMYFHSSFNPYGGYERLSKEVEGKSEEDILIRAYGVPSKSKTAKFPKFSRGVNVMKHEELPFIKDPEYARTNYMIIDPAGKKNWFMLWVAVDAAGTHWVYREWPDISYGEWGAWGKSRGSNSVVKSKPGPGQQGLGYGYKEWKELLERLETYTDTDGENKREEIFCRLIDPRLGQAEYSGKEGSTNIANELLSVGIGVTPAPGFDEDHGLQKIQDLLSYNTEKELSLSNHPYIYVSDRCENFITCMLEYTGTEGREEAWKDPVDCIRYGVEAGIAYVPPSTNKNMKVWRY